MEIPFHKPYITEDEVAGVLESLRSGWITMGPKTMEFEKMFGAYIGSRNAVSMNSCTAGLHLALKMIDLEEGDEVIVPSITFTATAEVIAYFRAIPVLVDVDEETCNIDVAKIEEKITPRTKAIIPVHFGGQPCDMDEIAGIAEQRNLLVVEDAAHAIPARYKNRTIGTISDMTCFSFYATKTLATGEGGMVTTQNDAWAERMKILRLHGISKDAWKRYTKEGSWFYEVIEAGYKYNMTDLQAALGLAQLRKVEWMWKRRKEIAGRYTNALGTCQAVSLPSVKPDRESAWHLYTIRLDPERAPGGRDLFIEELRKQGVSTSVHFIPLYGHPYYRTAYGYDRSAFPVSEKIFERTVSLPLYPGMTDEEADWVIQAVEDAVRRCS
ncbi:MAG TPA: DegT/DnrJ/EryC1/StrS family aminotransferase [Thermodesulfovibrionales bacterium]|nr:DegT/DnrJ/EryC1/StrS family aminotransferase [Thermodesulfovibrionales bacterium]